MNWFFFFFGSLISLVVALFIGVIGPLMLLPVISSWDLVPYIIGGGLILLLYYFLVVFGMSWMYEQFTRRKPDYWISSVYLLLIAVVCHVLIYFHHDLFAPDPFSFWSVTKGAIIICCLVPAMIRILGVTLIGAFYTKID